MFEKENGNLTKAQIQVLRFLHLDDFPAKDKGRNAVWTRAIAKVQLRDGNNCYAVVKKDRFGMPAYIKIFNPTSPIVEAVEFYPFEFLEDKFVRKFAGKTLKERIDYLKETGVYDDVDFSEFRLDELNKYVVYAGAVIQNEQRYGQSGIE